MGRCAVGLADEPPRVLPLSPPGAAELWVLDQRTNKSDPEGEDGADKTLLGTRQRQWLFDSLARSRARFKLICSPCTLFMDANSRDGNWSNDFKPSANCSWTTSTAASPGRRSS